MSSSESESDEKLKKFKSAIDKTLINDSMLKNVGKNKEKAPVKLPPSQRYTNKQDERFQSDLNVSKNMQDYCGKQLSELIESQYEFVDEPQEATMEPIEAKQKKHIKLTADVEGFLKNLDLADEGPVGPQVKPKIVKRKLTDEVEVPEKEKIDSSVVSKADIANVEGWKERKKSKKVFEYKTIKDVNYLKEPENEFTKQRKKNDWNESKIKSAKKKKKQKQN